MRTLAGNLSITLIVPQQVVFAMELTIKHDHVMITNNLHSSELLVISFSPLVDEKQPASIEYGFSKLSAKMERCTVFM